MPPVAPLDRLVVDLSNTIESSRSSGLQRVGVELSRALRRRADRDEREPEVLLVDGRSGRLRVLGPTARLRLEHRRSGGPGLLGRIESRAARILPVGRQWRPRPGDLLLDLEPSWHAPQPRVSLLPQVTELGAASAALVPDVLPLDHPEWFTSEARSRFQSWFGAHRDAGSAFFAISEATKRALEAHLDPARSVHVVRLGVSGAPIEPVADGLILMIGTVEPRKGHDVLLDALDLLGERAPTVDVVGQPGWATAATVARLRSHPSIRWHEALDDDQLEDLWQRASLLVQPTRGEGFGLPVAEAAQRRLPVIASDLPVLRESSQGRATFVPVGDASAWADALEAWTADRRAITPEPGAGAFRPSTWDDAASDILRGLGHETVRATQ